MSAAVQSSSETTETAVLKTRNALGIARLSDFALYDIQGPDAAKFLQNRLSNDVLALQPNQGQFNASLDRQGKIEGVFTLHRTAEGFFLISPTEEAESAIGGIEKYHIVEQFQCTNGANTFHLIACQGPRSLECLSQLFSQDSSFFSALPELSWTTATSGEASVRIVRRSFTGEDGFLLIVDTAHAESLWQSLTQLAMSFAGVLLSPEAWDTLRIEAGWPQFGADYTHETLLPETGLERLAVNYSKGCYLGQETIARVKTYGMLPKVLMGLQFATDAPLPSHGAACHLDGKTVGTIQSRTVSPTLKRPIALAYLGKNERIPGKVLNLEIDGQAYSATVCLLPFYDGRAGQKSGKILLEEGLKRFSEGYDEEAIALLQQAIEVEPSNVEAYEALGVILSRQERYPEAIVLMEKVLLLDAEHVLAHTNLSVYYMKLGDKDKAEEEKAKATMAAFSRKAKEAGLKFDPEAELRRQEQATLEKIAMFQEALKFSPDDPLGNFGLGSAFLELKRYDEAIAPFEKTIQAQPKHSVAYLSLGKALEAAGKVSEACAVYEKGIAVAAGKGDLMPLQDMQKRLADLTES